MNDLNTETAARFGVEPGWWFGKQLETRWGDLDPFGHVNNGAYLGWCEDSRTAYFAALGLPHFTADSPGPVLKEVGFTYDRALGFAESIMVTSRVAWVRTTSFRMEFAVWNGQCVGRGHAVCVWMVNSTGEKVAVADSLREQMARYDGAELRVAS